MPEPINGVFLLKKYPLILLALIFFYPNQLYAQDFWQRINTPDSLQLSDVMVDEQGRIFISCWEIYGKGGIYRSDDDGATWIRKNNGFIYPTSSIISLGQDDAGTLYAGGQSVIYKSINGGDSWTLVYQAQPYAANMWKIQCGYDSIILVGGGDYDGIIRSGDNGNTWEKVLELVHDGWYENITDIQFGPNGVIYACSRITWANKPGMVYASYDQGRTWQVFSEAGYPMALGFDNQGRLLRGEFGLGLFRYDFTTSHWENILYNGSSPRSILTVPDGKIFLACEYISLLNGGVMLSENDGDSYQFINSGFLYDMNDADNLSKDNVGRILVLNLDLYRSYDTISNSTHELTKNDFQINAYPNPFHSWVTIKFNGSFTKGADNMLFIYNATGQLIQQANIGNKQEYSWDGFALPIGLYFIKISNGKSTSTIKVLHY